MTGGTYRTPPVVILCGGRGTRLRERTVSMPKALVEIGARPIVGHVIDIYRAAGFGRFILATGYRGEMIEDFAAAERTATPGTEIECIDTGRDTPTGGRISKLADRLESEPFCATYADGLADIDLAALLAEHRAHGHLATITVARPRLPWGVVEVDREDRVRSFVEKPVSDCWVNGGFFCFEPEVLDYLNEQGVLEHEPLESLAAAGELIAHRHEGFWDCMDTYKDAVALNDLWGSGSAPWAQITRLQPG